MEEMYEDNAIGLCEIGDRTVLRAMRPITLGTVYTLSNGYWDEQHDAVSATEEVIEKKLYCKVQFIGRVTKHETYIYYRSKKNDLKQAYFRAENIGEDVSYWSQGADELAEWTYDSMYDELLRNINNFEVCDPEDDDAVSFEELVKEYLEAAHSLASRLQAGK